MVWFYAKQGNSTAYSTNATKAKSRSNPYKTLFKNGATIYPRAFYFVELLQNINDFNDRILYIKTAEHIKANAKLPWKEIDFKGSVESQFLFFTSLAKSILPFVLYKPDFVVLPVTIEERNETKQLKLQTPTDLQTMGF